MPLVNRHFSEACRDPSVWPELRVLHAAFDMEDDWWSFLRWLSARASGLQTLVFGEEGAVRSSLPWDSFGDVWAFRALA